MIAELISATLGDSVAQAVGRLVAEKLKRANLPTEARYAAYRDFRHAALRALLALDVWTTARPGLVGAAWSWPVALGSYRAYLKNMQEMVVQFAELVCVGTPEVAQSAVKVTDALVALSKEIHIPTLADRRRRPIQLGGYARRRNEVLEAMREFMVWSTADLGRSRPAKVNGPVETKRLAT